MLGVLTASAAQSLFDGIDFTLGATDAESSPPEGTSLFSLDAQNEGEQQESLFGGVKMSHSLKELEEEGAPLESLESFRPSRRASLSELQVTSRPRRPASGRRVASATVSVGLSGSQGASGSSLFDTVPFAGANPLQERGFGSSSSSAQGRSDARGRSPFYDAPGHAASASHADYADDYAADYEDSETQSSKVTHRFLLPSDQDEEYGVSVRVKEHLLVDRELELHP